MQLPSIVVVGDQSSGKSSVLESLAGISLPKGQGICTRVPLIMRLHSSNTKDTEISIEYTGTSQIISESKISGTTKVISDVPITLNVRKVNAPDLTMVDLPGITRVPVHAQPRNIYQQIWRLIMDYITPKAVELKGIGKIDLTQVPKSSGQLEAAFDIKMSLIAYWRVVKLKLADVIPMHLRFIFQKMVQSDLLNCIVKEVMGHDSKIIGNLLEESSVTGIKRRSLIKSVGLLRESKSTLSKIMDKLSEA